LASRCLPSCRVQASVGLSVYCCSGRLKRVRLLKIDLVHCLEKCLGTLKLSGKSNPSAFEKQALSALCVEA
jgi:hypothetical protein